MSGRAGAWRVAPCTAAALKIDAKKDKKYRKRADPHRAGRPKVEVYYETIRFSSQSEEVRLGNPVKCQPVVNRTGARVFKFKK